jgi:hypothetical protein
MRFVFSVLREVRVERNDQSKTSYWVSLEPADMMNFMVQFYLLLPELDTPAIRVTGHKDVRISPDNQEFGGHRGKGVV